MSTSIDQAFVKQFEREVHEAYQRKGSKLRGTVRTKNGIVGSSTTFQKVGKGTASGKSRHGKVTPMNIDHDPVECILSDHYAGDWVDKLDELKTNIDERQVIANAGAYALGRKTDELIIDAIETATNNIAEGSAGMTMDKFLASILALGDRDVMVDEADNMFCFLGWKEWMQMMDEAEFKSADYIPREELPFQGAGIYAKMFAGVFVSPHSGVTHNSGTDIATNFMYHRSAIGHAIAADVSSDITWHGDHAAHFINNMMSQGAVLIDNNGVELIYSNRSP